MDSFRIQIAGFTAEVKPLFESTQAYCRKYLSNNEPVFYISVTEEDLLVEQRMLDIEAVEEGLRIRKFTEPFLERNVIQRKVALELLKRNVLLVHGSAIGVDGGAYLFTASCGTGKSTHTRLWREVFGNRAVMVNDDKPFLKIDCSAVTAFGSPWSGKHGLDENVALSLRGICILKRGSQNRIHRLSPDDAREMILHQSFVPEDPELAAISHMLVDELLHLVPLWEMECNKLPDAARVSYAAMSANITEHDS